ncbi:uncharacterized protein K489DRAFT_377385 [Dissoconium aciculare CBS 342.82]|uniref:Uncharacterized protein n=1 Tax=Dissoconium aciculare CBS 342.82 TaxID=1314786 RepID=A0A6J3MAH2_9PEZI|nr:uncharacterized protein K489DRAFT_377385 [Dissoconium aciculare CBS 342.82]KAF1824858.1 hypothetical protein K489DRAFT_377385 [Dissoconium aciculare CBS 342.82]
MPYDEHSGQVFSETIVSAPRRLIKTTQSQKRLRSQPHAHGARSLRKIALQTTLRNVRGITVEVLQCLDVLMVEQLWTAIQNA